MAEQEHVATLMAALAAFNANDIEGMQQYVDPEVTYFIRGSAVVSGKYEGRDAVSAALRRIMELTGGAMAAEPEVIMAEGDNVMAYMHVTGSRPDGRTYDSYQAYLYRMRGGKLLEGQTIPVDQQAFAGFLAD